MTELLCRSFGSGMWVHSCTVIYNKKNRTVDALFGGNFGKCDTCPVPQLKPRMLAQGSSPHVPKSATTGATPLCVQQEGGVAPCDGRDDVARALWIEWEEEVYSHVANMLWRRMMREQSIGEELKSHASFVYINCTNAVSTMCMLVHYDHGCKAKMIQAFMSVLRRLHAQSGGVGMAMDIRDVRSLIWAVEDDELRCAVDAAVMLGYLDFTGVKFDMAWLLATTHYDGVLRPPYGLSGEGMRASLTNSQPCALPALAVEPMTMCLLRAGCELIVEGGDLHKIILNHVGLLRLLVQHCRLNVNAIAIIEAAGVRTHPFQWAVQHAMDLSHAMASIRGKARLEAGAAASGSCGIDESEGGSSAMDHLSALTSVERKFGDALEVIRFLLEEAGANPIVAVNSSSRKSRYQITSALIFVICGGAYHLESISKATARNSSLAHIRPPYPDIRLVKLLLHSSRVDLLTLFCGNCAMKWAQEFGFHLVASMVADEEGNRRTHLQPLHLRLVDCTKSSTPDGTSLSRFQENDAKTYLTPSKPSQGEDMPPLLDCGAYIDKHGDCIDMAHVASPINGTAEEGELSEDELPPRKKHCGVEQHG
jgi:hypothetical protein